MAHTLKFLCLCLLLAGITSCKRKVVYGEGESSSENRSVGSFTQIQLDVPVKAIIKIDSSLQQPVVALSGYKNLLSLIKTEIKDNTLRVYKEELTHFDTDKEIIVNISMPVLAELGISGSGEAEIAGQLKTGDFKLGVTGAGDVTIDNITATHFTADLSGAGDLEIKGGNADEATFTVTGAGDINAYGLIVHQAVADVTGAGNVELQVTDNLKASITGVGSISYKGHPAIVQNITGAGSLEDAN